MEADRFNEIVKRLRLGDRVQVGHVTGRTISGIVLQHTAAGAHDGTLELETCRGQARLLSSSILSIEPADDVTV